ncbi:MAG: hypothetical protein A2020_08685 [Lentisphaerae bacterium GWF2_45_14]|nr:MAG: hypothetical protein A2020_08685 [Lentisphaerae bacterium GWF2_45_14]
MPRIIVADDSRAQLAIYKCMIEEMGHKVYCCNNGREALDEFIKSGADLLILDVNMPELDGIQTCLEIRKNSLGISVPIIIVSSNDQEEDISFGLASGASDYLAKPIKNAELKAKINALLEGSIISSDDDDALEKYQTKIAGRYKIVSRLGTGSHSSVYLALDEQQDSAKIAVKIFSREVSKSKDLINGIIARLKEFSTFKCEHIIRVFDYGVFQGRPYCIMEYADGGDLQEYSRKTPLTESEAASVALDILKALKYFEKNNTKHLDIKPENIMMHGMRFKLADFGIIIERMTATLPVNAEFWSSASYMPPEILSGSPAITIKSDIYSLGVTLYQLISGKNPFAHEMPSTSMYKQMNEVPPALNADFKSISSLFSDTVARMLEKDPGARPTLNDLEYSFSHVARKTESPTLKTASPQSKKIFEFLCNASLSCNPCLITGQRFEYTESASSSFINRISGALDKFSSAPAIIQSDYGRRKFKMSDKDFDEVNGLLINQWRSGRVVSLAWYPSNPWRGTSCVDSAGPGRDLQDIFRHGSQPRMAFRKELARVAVALEALMKEKIPILWKPFPKPNGGENFWWGSTKTRMVPPDDFKLLWKEVFDFLINEKGLKNLIWTYSPSMQAEYFNSEKILYPGREYVDIIELEYSSGIMKFDNYRQISALGKPIGISGIPHPSGTEPAEIEIDVAGIKKEFPKIAFLIFSEKNILDGDVNYSYLDCPFFKHMPPPLKHVRERQKENAAQLSEKKAPPSVSKLIIPQTLPRIEMKSQPLGIRPLPPALAQKVPEKQDGMKDRLRRLKELFEEGLITEEEYKQKKSEVLKDI